MPLLHDVLNAYLSPLLKKHSIAGGFLTYEDLEASMELAKAVLVETPNEFVLKRVQKLHMAQIQAYNETAKKALEQWAQNTADIPAVEKGETQTTYVKRCLATTTITKPNWHVTDAIFDDCVTTNLRKRALQQFQQQQKQQNQTATSGVGPSQQTTAAHNRSLSNQTTESGMAGENGSDNDEEDGEVEEEEDGEMQDENDDDTEEEEGEEGENEDGEVGEEEDGLSPAGGDGAANTVNNNNTNQTPATTNMTGNNVNNPSKKRKPQKQIGGATTKKRVAKKKVQNQKKGGQKAAAATGGKKVVARKKGMAGKKRGNNNNKANNNQA